MNERRLTLAEARAHVLETLRQIDEKRLTLAEIEASANRYCLDPAHDALESTLAAQAARIEALEAEKNGAYTERNRVVAALVRVYRSGVAETHIDGWDPAWNGCVYIDTPEGQVSWHFHESDAYLFAGLPPYDKPWDGHTTEEKYERLFRVSVAGWGVLSLRQGQPASEGEA